MGGGTANVTISHPGDNWHVLWGNGGFANFQLDIVGFLAVLGEGSVTANAQVSALSTLFYLPRLMPAPQALLWPTRPAQLPMTLGQVTGVESGNVKRHVHHVAHVLLGDEMPTHTVRCVVVKKTSNNHRQNWSDRMFRGERKQSKTEKTDTNKFTQPSAPPTIKAKANGPMAWVALLGFGLSLTLFLVSLLFGDGMSLLATLLLSLLSTLIGIVNKWSLKLSQRPKGTGISAQKHVVIRYPNGSFLVVKCTEEVARELYFAPEEIEYNVKSPVIYRLFSLAGTLMLMGGVICLANAKLQLQFAWAGAYIFTNCAHFIAAAVPTRLHWDLSCYELTEEGVMGGPASPTFTHALFKTIVFTKNISWIKIGERAAPQTEVWEQWLAEAHDVAKNLGNHLDYLNDPIWPEPHPDPNELIKGTVWDMPEGWDAKREWDKINEPEKLDSRDSTTSTLETA